MSAAKQNYRPDIDGLRALAVLAVIAFHTNESRLSGGYVGVDVFFVISGFLITRIIANDIAKGSFTIARFYERRARRILPALFAMLLVVMLVGSYLLLPADFENLGKYAAGATLSVSNMISWMEFDYFAASDLVKPLLHCWSLGVEEQFYLVFPFILVLVNRFGKRRYATWILILALGSFALNIFLVQTAPSTAYFLVVTRLWELLVGSLLAIGRMPTCKRRFVREGTALSGLGLVAVPMFVFNRDTQFPGWAALAPCLGAALIIYAGGQGRTLVSRLLSLRFLVGIGLISYSLYLWHWPIIVFWKYAKIFALGPADELLIIALTFLVAYFSWRFVECPARRSGAGRKRVLVLSAAGIAASVGLGAAVFVARGLPQRLPQAVIEMDATRHHDGLTYPEGLTVSGDAPEYFVWGDSHAFSFLPVLTELFDDHGKAYATNWTTGGVPLTGITRGADFQKEVESALEFVRDKQSIHTVFLIARWAFYTEGYSGNIGPAEPPPAGARFSDLDGNPPASAAKTYELFEESLAQTIRALSVDGRRVVLVYPVPETGFEIPSTLAKYLRTGRDIETFVVPESAFEMRQARVMQSLDALGKFPNLVRLYPHEQLRTGAGYKVSEKGVPLYTDSNHLSAFGARLLRPMFEELF